MFVYISPEANILDIRGTPTPMIQKEPSKNKTQTSLKGQNVTISPASQGLSSRCACMIEIPVFLDLKKFMKTTEKIQVSIHLDEETVPEVFLDFQLLSNIALQNDNFKRSSIKKKCNLS